MLAIIGLGFSEAMKYAKRLHLENKDVVFVKGEVLLDLDYMEDSKAQVDANFVIFGSGKLVEI